MNLTVAGPTVVGFVSTGSRSGEVVDPFIDKIGARVALENESGQIARASGFLPRLVILLDF